ncbi:MAG: DNA polymerase III subunit alpha [Clostridia bacterium]|nr:DNA polymerase III subunit alpha [Clostridia bacterium]
MFAHLHTHSEFSLLDGTASIKKLISRVKELGMQHCAITDHGVMYGVVDFYKEALAQGIKPVIGCEVYMAPRSRFDKVHEYDSKYSHLILLCENQTGYKNLSYIVSKGFTEGFYYKPRIDFELLSQHSEGLIALSACLAGEIPKALAADDYEAAKKIAEKYIGVFGKNNFFIELQDHSIAEQKRINPQLIRLAKELGVGLVATNDIHYVKKEDAKYQDVLMCIQMQKTVEDDDRMKFETDEFYIKSPEEMAELFPYAPEAIENTGKIAERCNVEFDFETRHLPSYDVPDGKTAWEYLNELCREGLGRRYSEVTDELSKRLEYELSVIKSMGFVDYFLIVWDFINYAKKNGVGVGPGRGSAAGSIVAYTLEITDVDPIKYSLIFERFLNPERVSMPDIDVDFAPEGRQKVIDYVVHKYGEENVAQIITFGTMKAKLAIRDVGRALNIPYAETDKVAKLVPNELNITIDRALEVSAELSELYHNDPKIKELIDTSRALEGLSRHSGTHAAGVVICKEPIVNYMPLQTNDDVLTTQFVKDTVEGLGLLKMDFLGLRNLTVINNALSIIEKTRGIKIELDKLDYGIKEVYDFISTGNTEGVFQIESAGMKSFMQELKPNNLEDIIAGIALYRPGPMDSIPKYIYNKNHPNEVTYKHPILADILDVTYGCIVYQEQVLEIVRSMAGYSLGSADMLRRVISKKKADKMEIERRNFIYGKQDENGEWIIDGCIRRGIDEKVAIDIFDEINEFANYAFNKSHAAAYAFITYQTAYLKTFYPVEYMASLISSVEDLDKINSYLVNCKTLGIDKLPPDINMSGEGFTVEGSNIRFGLTAVKNVGRSFVQAVVSEREKNGKFKSFADFIHRMTDKEMNKRAVEGLIKCGAFDSLGVLRAQLINVFEGVIESEAGERKFNVAGQMSLFGEDTAEAAKETDLPDISEYPKKELLAFEKETTGIYFSGHPMEEYEEKAAKLTTVNIGTVMSSIERDEDGGYKETEGGIKDGQYVKLCGIITNRKNKTTKNNSQMAFLRIEDLYGAIEVIVFPKILTSFNHILSEESIVMLEGRVSLREDEEPKLLCEKASLLAGIKEPDADKAIKDEQKINPEMLKDKRILYVKMGTLDDTVLKAAVRLMERSCGDTPVCFFCADTKKRFFAPKNCWIDENSSILDELEAVFGKNNVKFG